MATHKRYDATLGEVVAWCNQQIAENTSHIGRFLDSSGSSWDGGIGIAEATRRAEHGDLAIVDAARNIVSEVSTDIGATRRNIMAPTIAGGTRVNIPAYLSGNPRCMARRQRQEVATRHVTIYAGVGAFGGVTADDMLQRGAAVLALVESLQQAQVAVDLKVMHEIDTNAGYYAAGDAIAVVSLEAQPVEIAVAGFCLGHAGFFRKCLMAYNYAHYGYGGRGAYSRGNIAWTREVLGAQPLDVVLCGATTREKLFEGCDSPRQWVEKHLHQITSEAR